MMRHDWIQDFRFVWELELPENVLGPIFLSICGNFINGTGYIIQKTAHNLRSKRLYRPYVLLDGQSRYGMDPGFLTDPLWWAGYAMFALGSTLHAAALAYGSVALLQPLESVTLVSTTLLSPCALQERISPGQYTALLTIIFGISLIVLFGPRTSVQCDLNELVQLFLDTPSLLFTTLMVICGVSLHAFAKSARQQVAQLSSPSSSPRAALSPWPSPKAKAPVFSFATSSSSPKHSPAPWPAEDSISFAPQQPSNPPARQGAVPYIHPVELVPDGRGKWTRDELMFAEATSYTLIAAVYTGYTMILTKAMAEMLRRWLWPSAARATGTAAATAATAMGHSGSESQKLLQQVLKDAGVALPSPTTSGAVTSAGRLQATVTHNVVAAGPASSPGPTGDLHNPVTYGLLALFLVFTVLGEYWKQQGLTRLSAVYVITVYQVAVVVLSSIGGGMFYEEFHLSLLRAGVFSVGMGVVCYGILSLGARPCLETEQAEGVIEVDVTAADYPHVSGLPDKISHNCHRKPREKLAQVNFNYAHGQQEQQLTGQLDLDQTVSLSVDSPKVHTTLSARPILSRRARATVTPKRRRNGPAGTKRRWLALGFKGEQREVRGGQSVYNRTPSTPVASAISSSEEEEDEEKEAGKGGGEEEALLLSEEKKSSVKQLQPRRSPFSLLSSLFSSSSSTEQANSLREDNWSPYSNTHNNTQTTRATERPGSGTKSQHGTFRTKRKRKRPGLRQGELEIPGQEKRRGVGTGVAFMWVECVGERGQTQHTHSRAGFKVNDTSLQVIASQEVQLAHDQGTPEPLLRNNGETAERGADTDDVGVWVTLKGEAFDVCYGVGVWVTLKGEEVHGVAWPHPWMERRGRCEEYLDSLDEELDTDECEEALQEEAEAADRLELQEGVLWEDGMILWEEGISPGEEDPLLP
eukprot:g26252.t1